MTNNQNKPQNAPTPNVFIFIFLLIVSGMASLYIFFTFIPDFSLIGLSLLLFLIILGLTDLFPFAPWAGFLLSTIIFTGIVYSILNNNPEFIITSGVGVSIFLITTLLIVFFNRQIINLRQTNQHLQQVIDSLVIYDRKTSLMRWKFAQQALTTEILRGRRYDSELSVILFEVWQKNQYSPDDLDRIHKEMASIIEDTIREEIDVGFISDQIGLILPETDHSGAMILAKRLVKKFNRQVDARLSAGIAEFPEDAVTQDDLIDRANQALKVAMNADQEVVAYHSLEPYDEVSEEVENDDYKKKDQKEADAHEPQKTISEAKEGLNTTAEKPQENGAETSEKQPEPGKSSQDEHQKVIKGSTKPIDVNNEHPPEKDYTRILKNINLDQDEWVVWIKGFSQMADLVPLEEELLALDHVQEINFLFLQANHLVLRLKSSHENLTQVDKPFPGWNIKKSNLDTHYLLLTSKKMDHETP